MIIYVVGDLHIGHAKITHFRNQYGFVDEQHHRETLISNWNNVVRKRDIVYVLGDSVFYKQYLPEIGRLAGRKILVKGNHCLTSTRDLLEYFDNVEGVIKYKKCWLSHTPIAAEELRGALSIHGHVHYATLPHIGYRNVSLENTIDFAPVPFKKVVECPWEVLRQYPDRAQELLWQEEYRKQKEIEKGINRNS